MRNMFLIGAAMATIAPTLVAAKDKPPIELAATSPWNLHYDAESCKLRRSFGTGSSQISIEMTKFAPGEQFQLIIFGKPLWSAIKNSNYTVAFGDLKSQTPSAITAAVGGNGIQVSLSKIYGFATIDDALIMRSFTSNVAPPPSVTNEQFAAIRTMTITTHSGDSFVLTTGPLSAAIAAWDKCVQELVRSWGIDPAVILKSPVVPIENPGSWLKEDDYPLNALRRNTSGAVNFRLNVDTSGRVTQCLVLRAVNQADFAKVTCDLLTKRARFRPALDQPGKPVKSYYVSSARFLVN